MPAVRIKDHWREQRLFDQRSLVCAVLMALATAGLLARLYVLQVTRHDLYSDLSQGNRVRTEPIPAARGLILDRAGEVIAGNQPAYQLELVPEEVPDIARTLASLVEIGLIRAEDVDELERTIDSSRSFDSVPIRLRMSDEDVARFAVRRFEFPGLDIKTRQTRWYPNGNLAVHALGYVGAISEQDLKHIDRATYAGTSLIGKLGVESAYEQKLHGTNGSREVLVNAQGRSVDRQGAFVPKLHTKAPVAGDDLVLSIDLKIQRVAETALAGHRGAVVAIDPNNGDVLALVSLPGFDPTLFGRGITAAEYGTLQNDIDRPLFNRALRGTYPPGSTIKPGIALAGLTYHVVDPATRKYCAGAFDPAVLLVVVLAEHARVPQREARLGRPGRCHRTLLRRLLLRARRRPRGRPYRHLPRPLRVRQDDRHRHQRREGRHPALARVEGQGLHQARRPDVVPGRDGQLRHRPGVPVRDAAAAGALRQHHRHARQDLEAAPGGGLPRPAHRADEARAPGSAGRGQRGLG